MRELKKNRTASFIILAIVYILATFLGVFTYRSLSFNWWTSLLIADVLATILTFVFSVILNNASVYDPYWSVQPPVILITFAMGRDINLLGILLLVAVCFWAIRLTANWAYTFSNLTQQDWRYTMLREKTKTFYPIINFVGIHMVPTLVVYACILPAVYAVVNQVIPNATSILFICLSLGAAILQGVSDIQMHKFQKNRNGTFIRFGLWKYSRHPNYLGEILMWWGIALSVVCAVPSAWFLIAGAVSNTILFLAVSIPMADGKQSKKQGFAEYKKQTRMLLPVKKFF